MKRKKSDEIKVDNVLPVILKLLRESSGYSIKEIAKKLHISPKTVTAVEQGKEHFTLGQLKRLAEIYKRPLAVFWSNPDYFHPLPPYRRMTRKEIIREAHKLALEIDKMVEELSDISLRLCDFLRRGG